MKKIFVTLFCLSSASLCWAAEEQQQPSPVTTAAAESHNMAAVQKKLDQQIEAIMQIQGCNDQLSALIDAKTVLEKEYLKIIDTEETSEVKKQGLVSLREANRAIIGFQSSLHDNQDIINLAGQIELARSNNSDQNAALVEKILSSDISSKIETINSFLQATQKHYQNAAEQLAKLVATTHQEQFATALPAPVEPTQKRWQGFVPELVKQRATGFWGRIKNFFWPQLPQLKVVVPTEEEEKTVIDATQNTAKLVDFAAQELSLGNYKTSACQRSIAAERKRLKSARLDPAQAFELARQACATKLAQHHNSLDPEKLIEQTVTARSWRVGILSTGAAYLAASKIFGHRPYIAIPCVVASYYFIKPALQFVCRGFLYGNNQDEINELDRARADYIKQLKRTPFCVRGTDETERYLAQ